MPIREEVRKAAEAIQKRLLEEGHALQGGFMAYCLVRGVSNEAVRERVRDAFMAGAESCFTSMMMGLDEGKEPTDDDMRRMSMIWSEIEAWRKDRELEFAPPGGSA